MQIPLNEFEQLIDEKILKRGISYFKGGAITDFSEISNGEYEARVSGTEEYTVQLKISNNTIVAHNCGKQKEKNKIRFSTDQGIVKSHFT